MSDFISRQAAIAEFNCCELTPDGGIDVNYAIDFLNQLPSVQPRKGKWELCGNHHLCSECDEWAFAKWDEDECDEVDVLTDFCPNCGCRMEEGDSE